jgi:serine/threonine protein kinase/Flp pilus assembly protein TadD
VEAPFGESPVTSSARPLAANDQIGGYKILGTAGVGGMGIVYKALDLKLERIVALKFLPNDLHLAAKDEERFFQEARMASSLDHANIGVIHGLEQTPDGHTFIVMAYYEGLTITEKVRRGPLPPGDAINIMMQVARGLSEAHDRNIIHRDIKPSNIIITRQNVAKIVDFGLARISTSGSTTRSLAAAGTLAYMSPEQVRSEPLDVRTDIWSLGVVFDEVLTGHHPFQRDNMSAILLAILEDPPPVDTIPAPLDAIVLRMLAKDRTHRYASCRELLSDLEACPRMQEASVSKASTRELKGSSRSLKSYIEHASAQRNPAAAVRRERKWWLTGVSVLLLIAISFLIPSVRDRAAKLFSSMGGEKHIAVLPFDNIGGDPSNEVVSEGLMQSLTSKLSDLDASQQSLWVVPASEVRRHKVTDPESALREFGATLVVEGSVQRDSSGIHLTVNLVRTKDVRQEGSLSLVSRNGDFATLQDEAVSGLAQLMHVEVPANALHTAEGLSSPAAYESYLKALGYMQRYDKPGNLDQAIAALSTAVSADSQFALGYAGLGEAYRLKYQVDKDSKWTALALTNGSKATELNDRLPSAYVTLGRVHDVTGHADLALTEFQRALQLDPRNADALTGLAHSYENAGRIADAEASYKKAIALRPDYWDGYNSLGLFYDRQSKYDDAIAQLQHAIELTPDNAQAYSNLGAFYLDTGDSKKFPQAETALKKSIQLGPSYGAFANLGYLYDSQKRYADSAAALEHAAQLNDKDYNVWANLASAYEHLNDSAKLAAARDKELPLLEQAAQSSPRDGGVQSRLALLYAQESLRDKSLSRLQTSLALAPDDPDVLDNVGEAYETLGDRAHAIQYIEKSLQKGYSLESLKSSRGLQSLLADPNFRPNGK